MIFKLNKFILVKKVLHFTVSLDQEVGGPARSIRSLLQGISVLRPDFKIDLASLISKNPINIETNEKLKVHYLISLFSLYRFLHRENSRIWHIHGIWQFPTILVCKIAQFKKIHYLISPRGMMEPWSLNQKSFKKKLALFLYQKNDLKMAKCIHATSNAEAKNIRKMGFYNPIAVIPNSLDLDKFCFSSVKRLNKILFLSRIHPKKGIEMLIDALSMIDMMFLQNWSVEIIGNGDNTYINSLNKLIIQKQLASIIVIKGPIFGKEKIQKYQESKIFVLPSYSENFGVAIAESLACGTPVITTKGTPWEDLEKYNCGWWIDNNVDKLKETLLQAMLKSDDDLMKMGLNGSKLTTVKFSSSIVAKKMVELYNWISTGKNKPDFII